MACEKAPDTEIRCLLISPLTLGVGFSGEDAYTEMLLRCPPEGVQYIFHEDLIRNNKGERLSAIHSLFFWLSEHRSGILPFNWVQSLRTNECFDLIHIHGWAVHLSGDVIRCNSPLIISASSSPIYGLSTYKGWRSGRIRRYSTLMRLLQKTLRIYDSFYFPGPARRILVWSKWARNQYIRSGIDKHRVQVVRPGLLAPESLRPIRNNQTIRFLFVGNDFVRKGGFLLLSAFDRLRKRCRKEIVLTVVSNYDLCHLLPEGVTWLSNVSRAQMAELYREHNAFVLPTYAEGYGMSVVEAMSFGLPVVVSAVGALPEIVCEGAGFVIEPGSEQQLLECLTRLVFEEKLLQEMSIQAGNCFLQRHEVRITNALLKQVYQEVLTTSH